MNINQLNNTRALFFLLLFLYRINYCYQRLTEYFQTAVTLPSSFKYAKSLYKDIQRRGLIKNG